MVMPRCQLVGYSVASVFLYVYPFVLDCKLFVGNNFSRRSPYTCIFLYLYGCLLIAGIFSINVLGGVPLPPSAFPFFLLLGGRGGGKSLPPPPDPPAQPEGLVMGPSQCLIGLLREFQWSSCSACQCSSSPCSTCSTCQWA